MAQIRRNPSTLVRKVCRLAEVVFCAEWLTCWPFVKILFGSNIPSSPLNQKSFTSLWRTLLIAIKPSHWHKKTAVYWKFWSTFTLKHEDMWKPLSTADRHLIANKKTTAYMCSLIFHVFSSKYIHTCIHMDRLYRPICTSLSNTLLS